MRRGAGDDVPDDERSVFADGDEPRRIARVEREGGDASDVSLEDEGASTVGDVEDADLVAGGDGDERGVGGDGDGVRGGAEGRVVEDGVGLGGFGNIPERLARVVDVPEEHGIFGCGHEPRARAEARGGHGATLGGVDERDRERGRAELTVGRDAQGHAAVAAAREDDARAVGRHARCGRAQRKGGAHLRERDEGGREGGSERDASPGVPTLERTVGRKSRVGVEIAPARPRSP